MSTSCARSFKAKAAALVDELIEKRSFDAVRDLAEVFPVTVFPDALGIDNEGRENFLTYGAMVFAGMGPENDYFRTLMAQAPKVLRWVAAKCQREALAPGSFGAQVYEAADTGEITQEEAPLLVRSFLSAGLDTTISATGMALFSLARHPEQWAILAANPSLARGAFDESLRYDSAAPYVFRTTPHEIGIAGVPIGKHEKVLLLIAFGKSRRNAVGAARPVRHHPARLGAYRLRHRDPRLRGADGRAARRRSRAGRIGCASRIDRDDGRAGIPRQQRIAGTQLAAGTRYDEIAAARADQSGSHCGSIAEAAGNTGPVECMPIY
ncbi:hypothetical protein [Bradyrhizobium barranii]|uniref:hypothetical protein n=1 Tax=Bradyrhizobium barranii TaxID=2992140 RepID=UPI003CCAEFB7